MRVIALCISMLLLVTCDTSDDDMRGGEVSIAYLWSLATSDSVDIKQDYTIRGYVVANDKFGELSSSFVVADATGGSVVEVDSRDVDALVPLFSEVEVRCSGLTLGRTAGRVVVGIKGDDDYLVSRIPETELYNRVRVDSTSYHLVEPAKRRIAELGTRDMLTYLRIDNLRAVERDARWVDIDTLTGERLTTIRLFTDGRDTLRVVTDARCYYAEYPLPDELVTLCGILDWHDGAPAFRITDRAIINTMRMTKP